MAFSSRFMPLLPTLDRKESSGAHDIGLAPWTIVAYVSAAGYNTFSYQPSGGIVFSGVAPVSKSNAYSPSGGIIFSGSAALAKVKNYAPSGGIVFGGTAALAKTKAYQPSGGIVFGGAAATSGPGATVAPGRIVELLPRRCQSRVPARQCVASVTPRRCVVRVPLELAR